MSGPSTAWREEIAPDEETRFAAFAEAIAGIQGRANQRYGKGRGFHRKAVAALRGTLAVPADLPEHARHGLFARSASYDVLVRLSNGAGRPQPNAEPDIRGFAIGVRGVEGHAALGGAADGQDFLLIQREVFGFKDVGTFVELAEAVPKGPLAVLRLFVRTYGLFAGFARLRRLLASLRAPFSGFLTEPFFSAAPIAWGPYAARVRLVPAGVPSARPAADVGDEVWARLASPATHALQAQFFTDEARTPIEDASVAWDAPWETVGTLTLPAQGPDEALAAEVEARAFDPWHALAEHRPLGHVMRARKAAYFASQRGRAPTG